jgi:polyferredoxin
VRNLVRSKYKNWIALRKAVQAAALIGFLALFIAAPAQSLPPALTNLPMRLDPLAMLAQTLASRAFLAGTALALIVILLTILFGRAWCGWLCPLGTVLDLFPIKKATRKSAELPVALGPQGSWRRVKYILLLLILGMALFGNLSLLIFDPLAILERSLTSAFLPAFDKVITVTEATLVRVPFLEEGVMRFDALVRPALLPDRQLFSRSPALFAGFLVGLIALNALAERFWCRYLCPLGGFLGLLSKFAFFRRRVSEDCKGCKLCSTACPTGTIDPEKGYLSDPAECTMCLDCMEACPRSDITISLKAGLAPIHPVYDPSRRQALISLAASTAAVAVFHSDWLKMQPSPYQLRPPGAVEDDLMSRCIRCGECLRICPTSALQPAIQEAGVEGLWTPILLPRLGYCDFACHACGEVCPTQAIPPLSLEEKRMKVIGKAYIDENRCIAWADHTDCIVCEEMCPLPEKAIQLEERQVNLVDGSQKTVNLPHVLRERCIGCGICEYKCPVKGESAIRVRVPTTL